MGKWINKKIMGSREGNQIIVEECDYQYRITYCGKWYYVLKSEELNEGFVAEDYFTFFHKMEEMDKRKPTRQTRRLQEQYCKKMLKKITKNAKKNGADIAESMIKTDALDNPESTLDEIKKEVSDNIKDALTVEEGVK